MKIYDSDVSNIVKLHKDSDTREATRGHSLKLFLERARTNVRKESFSLRVTRLWNDLPEVVVTAPSVNSFKTRLDIGVLSYFSKTTKPPCQEVVERSKGKLKI